MTGNHERVRNAGYAGARSERNALPGIGPAPEDFVVDEIPLYPPSGEGEHTFVRVEKRLRNSEGVRRELARLAGVRPAEVGYAGRKDRVAIARQWYRGAPGERERVAYQRLGLPPPALLRPPRGVRLRGARRPLRVRPEAASCEPVGGGVVRLSFRLPPGSYATVLVEELLARIG
jgi:tRNA(Glu) U13 pseudouridine synthase TruD